MLMSFIDKSFGRKPIVYILALFATAFVSIFDGLIVAGINVEPITSLITKLPLYEQNIGWLILHYWRIYRRDHQFFYAKTKKLVEKCKKNINNNNYLNNYKKHWL